MNYIKIKTIALLLITSTSHLSATTVTIPETTEGKVALIFKQFGDINQNYGSMNRADVTQKINFRKKIDTSKTEITKLIKLDKKIVDQTDPLHHKEPIIIRAAERGYTDIIKMLLNRKANINAISDLGYTALTHAVLTTQHDTIKLLLYHGADPTIESKSFYKTALHGAKGLAKSNTLRKPIINLIGAAEKAQYKANEIYEYFNSLNKNNLSLKKETFLKNKIEDLVDSDKNIINQRDPDHTSDREPLLMRVAALGNINTLKILLKRNVNVNATGSKGYTALMMAALFYRPDMAELLLEGETKANALLKNNNGETALDLARKKNNSNPLNETQISAKKEIIKLLEAAEKAQRKEKPAMPLPPPGATEQKDDPLSPLSSATTEDEDEFLGSRHSNLEVSWDDSKSLPATPTPQINLQDDINTTLDTTKDKSKEINLSISTPSTETSSDISESESSSTTQTPPETQVNAQSNTSPPKTTTNTNANINTHTTLKPQPIPFIISPEIIAEIKKNQKICKATFIIFFVFVLISTPSYFYIRLNT